ncbi:phosphoserine phosphatase SerB [Janibacter cremeus]|uniref:phosphoserine phosphatase SerB n=1 Tax=Janibacter cremeus TaxID=1285192 RepID=UPI0023F919CB|nr:phosphoserine phosphatase SerB [Janibacter cremeus]WEV79155.1 phosphoserine phosphatase SerB [Janibacter cremeus]
MTPLPGEGPIAVVLDVDSTLIQDEVIELIADHAGTREEVTAVTEAAMRGELDFTESLHARVATLEGLPVTVFDQVRAAVRLTPGARTLVSTLTEGGHVVGIVSGGFMEVVAPLAEQLGIETLKANTLEVVDGHLTGAVLGDVVGPTTKADFLTRLAAGAGIDPDRTVAIGDGANDLQMMAAAQLGIAFCAKPTVREHADVAVDERDLRRVLELLGIDPLPQEDDEGGHPLA